MTLAERILAKTPLPTHLDSATIRARVAQQIREQAFFSAQMTLGGYLKDLQRLLAAYAEGQMDASQVRIRARAKLDELGFSTVATGLQDPRSPARLNLILKTNEQMAAGMAQRDLGVDPLLAKAFPAWELVSGGFRKVHRTDWPRRWQAAGDAVAWRGALKGKRMVALKTSPIWAALGQGAGGFKDTLGNPYPPFAFGSSYEWSELSILEAQDLGLVPKSDSALNKRDTHGHFATTEGEACTQDEKQGEDTKTQVRKVSDAWSEKPAKGSSIKRLKCSRAVGEAFLEDEPETKDSDRTPIIWSRHLIEKYRDGKGRKNGPDPERLTLVAAAVITTRFPAKKVKDYRGEQSFYYREFDGEAIAVFVDNDTRKVNGFMKGTIGEVRDSIGHKYFKKK